MGPRRLDLKVSELPQLGQFADFSMENMGLVSSLSGLGRRIIHHGGQKRLKVERFTGWKVGKDRGEV